MNPTLTFLRTGLLTLTALALTGCASVFLVDNDVQSYARWQDRPAGGTVPAAPQLYRFERLPSQQDGQTAQGQAELERLTEPVLAKLGWTRAADDVRAPWTVQVAASTVRLPHAPWEDPWDRGWGAFGPGFGLPGRDYVVTGTGQVIVFPAFPRFSTPYYQRGVSLLVRDAASGRVVYETRAAHDGRWHSSPGLWTAMLDAALQGFPTPPSGVRRVNIEVPR